MHYPFNCRLSAPTYTPAFVRFNIFHFPRSRCNTLSELFITAFWYFAFLLFLFFFCFLRIYTDEFSRANLSRAFKRGIVIISSEESEKFRISGQKKKSLKEIASFLVRLEFTTKFHFHDTKIPLIHLGLKWRNSLDLGSPSNLPEIKMRADSIQTKIGLNY